MGVLVPAYVVFSTMSLYVLRAFEHVWGVWVGVCVCVCVAKTVVVLKGCERENAEMLASSKQADGISKTLYLTL